MLPPSPLPVHLGGPETGCAKGGGPPSGILGFVRPLWFIGSRYGWVGGNGFGGAELLRTVDGGVTWHSSSPLTVGTVDALYFVDPQHGWLAGNRVAADGTPSFVLLGSSDGGKTWADRPLPAGSRPISIDLSFLNPRQGWLLVNNLDAADRAAGSAVYATTDGGKTWVQQLTTSGWAASVFFLDARHGWVAGVGSVWITTDGGTSFEEVSLPAAARTTGLTVRSFRSIRFTSAADGWLAGKADAPILVSHDGGLTWAPSLTGSSQADALWATDASHLAAIVYGQEVSVALTSNGGRSWSTVQLPNTGKLFEVSFPTPLDGWVSGISSDRGGALWHTHDGGRTWAEVAVVASR